MKIPVTAGGLCRKLGMSRQNYYKSRRERQRREADSGLTGQLVRAERAVQPRLGGRKLFHIPGPKLAEAGVTIGWDRFFEVLKEKGLPLDRLPGIPRATDSRHSLPVFHNLVRDMELAGPDQARAADITCIRTGEGFLYLSLLTDLWSRKIVGFHAGDTLESEGAVRALESALSELPKGMFPVHHSDRGCQYCSRRYVEKLRDHGLPASMTEDMHCYENARTERLNGILKQEYSLICPFRSKKQALAAIGEAVSLYNTRRPHLSLGYETPETVHRRAA
ncbi:MAG: IS3 family transposase [Spirochaetaceae bacterium]|jgi:transposase InsO family protein|nr:IS3 family transposase [Spirochaetaceae bacterium]